MENMSLEFHKLRCFITVVEEGSISKAAVLLNMTQPPLSTLIRKLEDSLNVTLFVRHGKRLILTDTGRLLYNRAKELVKSSENIVQELVEQHEGMRGVVHIGCTGSANLFIIPKVVERLRKIAPNIQIRVRVGNSAFIVRELRNHTLDVGIIRGVFRADDLDISPLQLEPLLLALPPDHRLLTQPSIHMHDLKDEKFLLLTTTFGHGISDQVIESCQTSGFYPDIIYWGTEILPMLLMVKNGIGITFVPQCFQELHLPGLPPLIPISSQTLLTRSSLITVKNRYTTAVTQRFLDVIREIVAIHDSDRQETLSKTKRQFAQKKPNPLYRTGLRDFTHPTPLLPSSRKTSAAPCTPRPSRESHNA
ncbi:LysR family transcriptional regulator [Brevibacillus massiliensis]|uniref:LysR family transcriptional regulator n=1 Tax=Brevibacillus massiliensis TaxID=1118054 RepID=UPI000362C8FC|nr:LysR family transcriptional regulator [Brevibacillus massiliensis]